MANTNLFAVEREQTILHLLKEKGRLTVAELTELFDVTPGTMRRQLNEMEQKGLLLRTHGGATSTEDESMERSLYIKAVSHAAEKRVIAAEARKYISDGDIIMLGGGTTVLELAHLLHDARDLVVITNSMPAATELYPGKNIEVHICGGVVREKTGVVIGSSAIQFVKDLRADKTFIGADSISVQHGITTPNNFEAEVESQLVRCGGTVFVLADSSKMNRMTLAKQSALTEVDYIITDSGIDHKFSEALRSTGNLQVVIAANP